MFLNYMTYKYNTNLSTFVIQIPTKQGNNLGIKSKFNVTNSSISSHDEKYAFLLVPNLQ